VEELSVGAGSDLIDDGGLEIEEDAARDVLASTSLGEEGVEGIVATANGLVGGHLTIRLDTVLEAEELPAGVTDLDTSLTDVDGDNFTHDVVKELPISSEPTLFPKLRIYFADFPRPRLFIRLEFVQLEDLLR